MSINVTKIAKVMYCLPPGAMPAVAYGVVNSFISVYSDKWCTYVSATMHEIGVSMIVMVCCFLVHIESN